jgi:hypothetical protein
VDVSNVARTTKLAAYLGKYLGKGFDFEGHGRIKRFASSKGIPEPERVRSRMHARMGEHVYRFRTVVERSGWVIISAADVSGIFEGAVAGRRILWAMCRQGRARSGDSS